MTECLTKKCIVAWHDQRDATARHMVIGWWLFSPQRTREHVQAAILQEALQGRILL
jgi:hypothetical protein